MQLQPAPTSPKARLQANGSPSRLEQPARTPWGRIWLLAVLISLGVFVGGLAGLAWLIRAYPDSVWLQPWAFTSTTVIERSVGPTEPVTRPTRTVQQTLLVVTDSQTNLTRPDQVRAGGLPLSTNGWFVTLRSALPAEGELKVINSQQQFLAIERRVDDPAGVFTYLKVSGLDESPASFTPLSDEQFGERLWLGQRLIGVAAAIETRLSSRHGAEWQSSDQLDAAWSVTDLPATASSQPLMDDRGYVYALVDQTGQAWPTAGVEPILKQLLQTGTVDRPALGIRALDLGQAVARSGQDRVVGWYLGQTGDDPAVAPDSPAAKAGLQAGDRIISMGGETVSGPVWTWLQRFRSGETVPIVYDRGGVRREATLELSTVRP